ncbi:hypothetical protein [Tenacibaculum sp. L6]|uniref:hypothetical protein n=1 Tax=Tenacibaculum sp. L6 TaxID=2992764 RepID=UPI00237C0B46|nr:hypothetical protein [Tenacibaculum sp. L6]MDE0535791.1 hypothetical protein [Tenacibaculum sp. L6]
MFDGEEAFKFHIRFQDIFKFERLMLENNIQFHNELEHLSESRSNKYYIRNSDRKKFDAICVKNQLEIYLDSLPNIETRLPKFTSNSLFTVLISVLLIFLIIIILIIS